MGEHPREADGRRVLSTECSAPTVQRILTDEKTLAELSRELRDPRTGNGSPRRARRQLRASEDLVPASCARPMPRFASSSALWTGRRWTSRCSARPRRS